MNISLSDELNKKFFEMSISLALIETIEDDTYNITFRIPNIVDNLSKYPTAMSLVNHIRDIVIGDPVVILRPSNIQNDFYFYFPLNIDSKLIIRNKEVKIDVTTKEKVLIDSPEVRIKGNLLVDGEIAASKDITAGVGTDPQSVLKHKHTGNLGAPTGIAILSIPKRWWIELLNFKDKKRIT